MTVWLREIVGWILVALGLFAFGLTTWLLLARQILEAPTMAFIGFVVFRGGIHLLKVAVAARLARQTATGPIERSPGLRPVR